MRKNLKISAKKFATSAAAFAVALAFAVSAFTPATFADSGETTAIENQVVVGNPSPAIHLSPLSFREWRKAGYVFPGAFELYTFNWAKMSAECRAQVVQMSVDEQSKFQTCGEYTISELLSEFAKVWVNGRPYQYRIEK